MAENNKKTCLVRQLSTPQIQTLKALLEEKGWILEPAPFCFFRTRADKLSLSAYENGKLVIQGKNAEEFLEFILEPIFRVKEEVPPQTPFLLRNFSRMQGPMKAEKVISSALLSSPASSSRRKKSPNRWNRRESGIPNESKATSKSQSSLTSSEKKPEACGALSQSVRKPITGPMSR